MLSAKAEADTESRPNLDDDGPYKDSGKLRASPSEVQAAIQAQREFLESGFDVSDVNGRSLRASGPDYPGGPEVVRPPYREVLVGKTGGMTALLHAAREGHIEAAVALLDGGPNIDQVSADQHPLLIAALNGQFDLAMIFSSAARTRTSRRHRRDEPLFAVLQTQWAPKSN